MLPLSFDKSPEVKCRKMPRVNVPKVRTGTEIFSRASATAVRNWGTAASEPIVAIINAMTFVKWGLESSESGTLLPRVGWMRVWLDGLKAP